SRKRPGPADRHPRPFSARNLQRHGRSRVRLADRTHRATSARRDAVLFYLAGSRLQVNSACRQFAGDSERLSVPEPLQAKEGGVLIVLVGGGVGSAVLSRVWSWTDLWEEVGWGRKWLFAFQEVPDKTSRQAE